MADFSGMEQSQKEYETFMNNAKWLNKEYKHDAENSTDDNVSEVIHDSEDDILFSPARDHYNNLSDSHQSPIDDEEEKMEQEIITRLSHLKINRNIDKHKLDIKDHFAVYNTDKFMDWSHIESDNDSIQKLQNDDNADDTMYSDDDADNIRIDVGDEHYEIINLINNSYTFSIKQEFLSNETFLKYSMLYATIYFVSKYSLNRVYKSKHKSIDIDVNKVSRNLILVCNATVAIFKNHDIWNQAHRGMVSQFRDMLTENQINFMDIEKAFYCIMLLLSYFGNKENAASRKLSCFYNLICIGCIILIKKYKKIGALYIYTSFWMQLSSLFLNASKILIKFASSTNGTYSKIMKHSGVSAAVMYALTMIYSRVFLFSKVMVPVIQNYYRKENRYIGSIGSFVLIGFLISGYYRLGDGFVKVFIQNK